MNNKRNVKLFVVDDDALYLRLLKIEFLQYTDFTVETYPTGETCIENLSGNPDLIILDYFLDSVNRYAMNGIRTLDKIKAINPDIPVVMLSSQDSIEVAIKCMHHKASDYIVKSETAFIRLHKVIGTILHTREIEKTLEWYIQKM
jgi:two-component system, OmpR family, response regulator